MSNQLAIDGGSPVRSALLPYGRQIVDEDDIQAVTDVLKSDWLTTGPTVDAFEKAFADFVGTKEAVAVSNGTAALHSAIYALGIEEGDEVIVPTMTFASTANIIIFQKGTPVFVDSEPGTALINPQKVEEAITEKTKAVIVVDYAGQPCDYDALHAITEKHGIKLLADACHALGGTHNGKPVGSLADLSTFSFHPVKPMTTGEGGMITTDDPDYAHKMRRFRNHNITSDHRERHEKGSWFYEMAHPGFNYRITDFQCALGLSQLKKVPDWVKRRQEIARIYDQAFETMELVEPLTVKDNISHAYHIYVITFALEKMSADRGQIFQALRAENIGVNVHYIPVHLHPFYKEEFGTKEGMFPVAEDIYSRMITLPVFPAMSNEDANDVIGAVKKVCEAYIKS